MNARRIPKEEKWRYRLSCILYYINTAIKRSPPDNRRLTATVTNGRTFNVTVSLIIGY